MNVLVGMLYFPRPAIWRGGFSISGVDFGCFSTWYGDCEALDEREGQVTFTLFACPTVRLASRISRKSRTAQRSMTTKTTNNMEDAEAKIGDVRNKVEDAEKPSE